MEHPPMRTAMSERVPAGRLLGEGAGCSPANERQRVRAGERNGPLWARRHSTRGGGNDRLGHGS